jgi:hypothetical protein
MEKFFLKGETCNTYGAETFAIWRKGIHLGITRLGWYLFLLKLWISIKHPAITDTEFLGETFWWNSCRDIFLAFQYFMIWCKKQTIVNRKTGMSSYISNQLSDYKDLCNMNKSDIEREEERQRGCNHTSIDTAREALHCGKISHPRGQIHLLSFLSLSFMSSKWHCLGKLRHSLF